MLLAFGVKGEYYQEHEGNFSKFCPDSLGPDMTLEAHWVLRAPWVLEHGCVDPGPAAIASAENGLLK